MTPRWVADALLAAAAGAVLSGAPSTLIALCSGADALGAARAAGALIGRPTLTRGALVHAAVSAGWGLSMAAVWSRRPRQGALGGAASGACAGVLMAALDLELVARLLPVLLSRCGAPGASRLGGQLERRVGPVAALPQLGQWLDHVCFGAVTGAVLGARAAARGCGHDDRTGGRPASPAG